MKIKLTAIIISLAFLVSCSTSNKQYTAETLNNQLRADHLPEWLLNKRKNQSVDQYKDTYSAMRCYPAIKGASSSLAFNSANNLARAELVGVVNEAIRYFSENDQGAFHNTNEGINELAYGSNKEIIERAFVQKEVAGISIVDNWYEDGYGRINACSLAVIEPDEVGRLVEKMAVARNIMLSENSQKAMAARFISKETRDVANKRWKELSGGN